MTDSREVTDNLVKMYRVSFIQNLYYRLFCAVTGLTGLPKDSKILDCACGTGSLLSVLKDMGYKNIEGFDASPEMVAIARERTGCSVVCCNALEMGSAFQDKQFDVVIVANFLHHLTSVNDWHVFLDACAKVMKKGGIWINREPCVDTLVQQFFKKLSEKPDSLLCRIPALRTRAESWILEKELMDHFRANWEPNFRELLGKHGLMVHNKFRLIDSTIIKAVILR